MKQDISIILAVHLCTLISEEQVGMPRLLTATDTITDCENVERVLNFSQHNVTSGQVTAVSNVVLETEIFCRR